MHWIINHVHTFFLYFSVPDYFSSQVTINTTDYTVLTRAAFMIVAEFVGLLEMKVVELQRRRHLVNGFQGSLKWGWAIPYIAAGHMWLCFQLNVAEKVTQNIFWLQETVDSNILTTF